MDKSEQGINNNVNENTVSEVCEVPVNGLDGDVSIVDLREELGLVVEQVSDDVKSASVAGENDASYTQIDVAVEESDVDVSAPSQEELISLANKAQELSQIEPVAGEAVEEVEVEEALSNIAKKVAEIEPEAGTQASPPSSGNASGGGYGFQSSFDAQGVINLDDVGPIDPTQLQYGIDNRNDELFVSEESAEIPPLTPVLEIGDYQVYEDGSVRVAAFAAPEVENSDITVVISGIPAGWSVTDEAFDFSDLPIGTGVFDAAAGTWTITLTNGAVLDGGPVFSPPADSDVDALNLVFSVNESNPDGNSGSTSDVFDIIVDAVADKPDVDGQDDSGAEGTTLDIDVSALTGEEVNNGAGADDGSESITGYQISGVPAGFTLSAGTETAPGSGIYNLTSAEIVGLQITPNDPDFSGSIGLAVTVFTTENVPTDSEFDLTNNDNQDSDKFILTWNPVADKPTLKVADAQVKEDNSVDIPVEATLSDTDGSEFLTITVTGIPTSWGFSGTGWVQTAPDTYEVVVPAGDNYADFFTLTPPADSDIDLTGITVTATSTEVANMDSAFISETIDVIVDAVYDAPDVDGLDNAGKEGTPLDVDITGSAGDTDGSESVVKYEISDVPTGFNFNQGTDLGGGVWSFTPAELAGLQITPPADYVGDIDLTVTVFTTENPVDSEFDASDNTATEADIFNLEWKPVANPPCVQINQGVDDALVKEDNSVDVPITATLDPAGSGNEILTVTVSGIDASWGFTSIIGTYDSVAGTWTITLPAGQNLSTVFTFTPPADSDVDMTGLVATASAYEPSTDTTANATPDGFQIIVDAVADAPTIDAANDGGNEGDTLDIDLSALTGEEVNNGAGSDDGSESITGYQISGVPAGFVLSAGVETAPGSGIYILTPAEIVGLQITPTDSNYFGAITLTATVLTTENPVSDGEFDPSDNNAQASDTFTLEWCPVINPPSIEVNNGVDDALVKEDNSIDVPITAQLGANPAAGEYLTITVTGIDAAWGTFTSTIGTYDSVAGTWTITLGAGESLDTVFNFAPNGDSDIDLTGLVATVVATDPDAGISASANDDFNVIVDAVADTPDLDTSKASGEEGTTIPLTITTSVNDTDGSEVIEVIKIGNLPAGATLSAGTYNAVDGVWELSPADLIGLGINIPDGVTGTFELTVESVAYEQNTNGTEVDLTDNRASAFDVIKVCVEEDDIPVVENDEVTVDETDLAPTTSASGNIVADFGSDAPGSIEGNGTYLVGSLTSGGVAVVVAFDALSNTYTGTAGVETIFTLVIQSNGDYTFTLEGVIDHPDEMDHNDSLALEFGVTATDSDGDEANAVITVNVLDDGPVIYNKFAKVDETDLENGPIGYTKTLDFDFGEDGAGSIDPTGNFVAKFQVGGPDVQLTSGGVVIDVVATADGYVGTAGAETIFTLVLDALTGEYTYTQFTTIDHPDATNHDDVIWLKFEVQVTDADGDTATAIIGVDVHDDGPVAHDDCVEFNASEGVLAGNVVDNDDLSQDADNTVTQIKFDGNVFDVPADGSDITINGTFGSLTINNTGEYTYDVFGDAFSNAGGSSLDPVSSDVTGTQTSITKDGITVEIANAGDYDISWVNTADGSGLGIDNLNSGDSTKVWPKGETFDVSFDKNVQNVTLTIAELGSNNDGGQHGLDYVVTLADGTEVVGEQQFVPSEIVDGHFTFTLDASDFGGQLITGISINSVNDGQYSGASFLLNNVEVEYPYLECVQDQFEYVLTDGDGDTDVAVLKIKTFAPDDDLIVGRNVNDNANSDVSHLVNGDEGVIEGAAGNDILVGDAGGSYLEPQTQDYNFVFILDVSGSMGSASDADSRISLLKASVEKLLNEFGVYNGGDIKIHITPFATGVGTAGTFTVTDAQGLVDALAYLDTLSGSGYTNYEAPLEEANTWLQSGDPIGGDAITTTYFISDGNPNRYLNADGNNTSGGASTVMAEITGADGSDEVGLLHSLNDNVIAVGVNASASVMTRLNVIDMDSDGDGVGEAINIADPSDLTIVFADTSPLNKLSVAGCDTIEGGEGRDIIFGDVLFTDDLATLHGLTTDNGSGWEVFERLENGESATNIGWSRDDTVAYIRANAEALSEESIDSTGGARPGGHDVINGGAGDDLIFAQEGNDIISGGLGNDVIYGGAGADIFLFEAINEGVDTVKDFDFSEGDVVDFSALLSGYDSLSDDIADFVIATEVGGNTILSVDQSGNTGVGGSVELVILEGVTGLDLDASIKTDTAIV
ncbi:MAG: hypothetical protein COA45_08370 [Zetaproteobacteria bacterium]|nr:MAG: hypothetical protein COA45_08370 [Zetaproteobacteria bacterium]